MTAATAQKNTGKNTGKRGKAPGSVAHQFQPGKSGNPNGRPQGALNYKTVAMKVWAEVSEEQADAYNKKYAKAIKAGQKKPKTAADFPIPELLIKKHTIMALSGDRQSLDSVQDRFFGKAAQPIVGDPDAPIEHSIESKKERARRMLSMFGVPAIDDRPDETEQEEVEPAAAPRKPRASKPKAAPAKVEKQVAPGKKQISRRPIANRYTKK